MAKPPESRVVTGEETEMGMAETETRKDKMAEMSRVETDE